MKCYDFGIEVKNEFECFSLNLYVTQLFLKTSKTKMMILIFELDYTPQHLGNIYDDYEQAVKVVD